jgi:hypothetical protein
MTLAPVDHAYAIFRAATTVIRIHGVGGKPWKRNVEKGARIGPWLPASYDILDKAVWEARRPCLYLVAGGDGVIRYVGISRNRLKDRWRLSPAHDAQTMARLAQSQLFHSQCWKYIERESALNAASNYEVRCIDGATLLALLERLGPPLSAFTALRGDDEGIVAGVERWLCNNQGPQLVAWNVSMTG